MLPLALVQIIQVPLHGGIKFRHERPRLAVSAAQQKRREAVWDGFKKAVVFNMVAKLPPGEHQTVVCRRFERDGVRHDALCLARMRRAAAALAFRLLRVGEQDSKEREVEIQHKAGGKAVLSPELVAQPAVNGLEARFVLLAEVRLGRPDVTKHALEKTHDGEGQLAVFLRARVADDRGDDAD